ncbi:MarR family transcriptional regulator [Haloarcula amylovorans]|uniref:MarR family transcriptional regulator n=1 Tax=Haloarcula amylovorans TaxID=2562280 RepID=UPI0010763D8E|nr:helix-turn-helix domain-containing protein [Halomicroarcula amylolytica]
MSKSKEPPTQPTTTLAELPPSAKLVLKVLENADEKLTQQMLTDETYMPRRTTRHALRELRQAGFVEEEVHFGDARKRLYSLTDEYVQHVEPRGARDV